MTVDRLWNSYSQATDLGAEYQRIYESEKDRIAAIVAEEGLEYEYIEDYRSFSINPAVRRSWEPFDAS
ncbi:hypothetical protein K227x_17200 [Rubripirellula lacrimiformis]|uniref:Uncharacterized protein n=1 Tax=Rubripirellula lacrimiformis TaxID=1930273 RepID=A0A517N8K5_9BACT|nr:hypothetical protein [Rubripirellula lacrimiformis]QDT03338.1 hypothetical protein K227x_17200 [Rubripirellula lacrimiformis]